MNIVRKITIYISLFFISINGLIGQDCENESSDITWDFQIVTTPPGSPLVPGTTFFIECYVTDFVDILTFQYTISFNPNVLEFCSVDNLGSDLIGNVEVNDLQGALATGSIPTIWTNGNGEAQTIDDGPIFKIFMKVVGDPGECSEWFISDNIVEYEVAWDTGDGINFCTQNLADITQQLSGGDLCIECGSELSLITSACGGDLELSACGGTGPYDFTLEGPGGTIGSGTLDEGEIASFTGLPSGLYLVTMSDDDGNTLPFSESSIDIEDTAPLSVAIDIVNNIACANGEGDLMAAAQGGVMPYTYEWSNGLFSENAENLSFGDYNVTVTDANGCTAESPAITLGVTPMEVTSLVVTPATCQGSLDGSVTIVVEGGTPINGTDYFYEGFGNGPVGMYTGLNPGMITINIFDEPNCFLPVDVEIPAAGTGDFTIVNEEPIECFGDFALFEIETDFLIPTTAAFDSFPMIIDVNDPLNPDFLTNPLQNGNLGVRTFLGPGMGSTPGLPPGSYLISFYTLDGCFVEVPYDVGGAPEIVIDVLQEVSPDCDGNAGQIEVTIDGGVGNLTYSWNTGQPDLDFEVTEGGTYTIVVTDQNMCSDSVSIDITDPGTLGLTTEVVNGVGCGAAADSGSVQASITSTGTNITYTWEDANGDNVGNTALVDGLGVGTYYVTVEDTDAGCSQVGDVTIDGAGTFFFNPDLSPLTCFDGMDAEIEMAVTGGVGPFTYDWSHDPSLIFNTASNLSAGSYTVTITDSDQCQLDTTIVIEAPDQMDISFSDVAGVSCFNGLDGSAISMATNSSIGATEFTFFWETLEDGMIVSTEFGETGVTTELPAGEIITYAFDGQCFSDTLSFEIMNADEIVIDSLNSIIQSPPCSNVDDGIIEITALGGAGNFEYNWDGGETGNVMSDLAAGDYTLFVTDDNDCVVEFAFDLEEPVVLEFYQSGLQAVSCFGDSTAVLGTIAEGGSGSDYTFEWTPNISNTNIAENVGPGNYTVTVTDGLGCTATLDFEVTSTIPIEVDLLPIAPIPCNAGTTEICLSASGGTGFGYNYQVNFGNNIPIDSCFTTTAGDNFMLSVTDSEGCPYDQEISFSITQPLPIEIDLSNGQDLELGEGLVLELGDSSLVIDPIISSPNPIQTYDWSSESNDWDCVDVECESISVFPTAPSIYSLLVTDENGCTADASILIDIKTVREIFVPNIFTPDKDGNNELFQLYTGKSVSKVLEWKIYDRWGNEVHSAEDINPGEEILYAWDGRFQGIDVVPGVYVYIAEVEFVDDEVLFFKGSVTLLR